jgi:hypothetical protein
MSQHPPYGFYPQTHQHPQYYPHPNQPIPHRGEPISSTQSRASTTSLAAMAAQTEEEDAALEDGGWGRDGPLMQQRKAAKRKQKGRKVDSGKKTADWLKTAPEVSHSWRLRKFTPKADSSAINCGPSSNVCLYDRI